MPTEPTPWNEPPIARTGDPPRDRRVGVELEFAGVPVNAAAEVVREAFGGAVAWDGSHRAHVNETALGDFRVEVDMNLAHRKLEGETERGLRDAVVDLSSAVVPIEIVCPPISWREGHRLDVLCARLKAIGAEGTRDGLLYAFGAQLNPEPPDLETGTILDTLRAFILLRDWLRAEIGVDRLRRLWRFEQQFPDHYTRRIMAPDYAPDRRGMIEDYLLANPTRDRELDLLPLFSHLDDAIVRRALPGEKINARPTWHYRLPNSEISDAAWNIGVEWNRWVRVERLAARPDLLASAADAWLMRANHLIPRSWLPDSVALAARL
jgi:hypothetical protein